MALLVEHPMPNKMATGINGYHMGRWPKAADGIVPRGFVEVTDRLSDFPLSPHLRLSDFVVHDAQDGFPKYLHVRESVLDKVELIVSELAQMRGRSPSAMKLNVASGFRSPAHNGELSGTASDSRHMYGDAADIAVDANNDGRLTEIDARLVAAAAEVVERRYPDLVGGVGLYITTDGAGWPYVHVDTRGHRARWRGGVRRGGAVSVDSLPSGASFDSVASVAAAPAAAPAATAKAAPTRSSPATTTSATTGTIVNPSSVVTTPSAPPRGSATGAAPSSKGRKPARRSTARPASSRRRSTSALTRESAASHSRSVVRTTPASANARTADDPFASAARKFRASRP
jgi:hypothetical protein